MAHFLYKTALSPQFCGKLNLLVLNGTEVRILFFTLLLLFFLYSVGVYYSTWSSSCCSSRMILPMQISRHKTLWPSWNGSRGLNFDSGSSLTPKNSAARTKQQWYRPVVRLLGYMELFWLSWPLGSSKYWVFSFWFLSFILVHDIMDDKNSLNCTMLYFILALFLVYLKINNLDLVGRLIWAKYKIDVGFCHSIFSYVPWSFEGKLQTVVTSSRSNQLQNWWHEEKMMCLLFCRQHVVGKIGIQLRFLVWKWCNFNALPSSRRDCFFCAQSLNHMFLMQQ